MWFYGCNQDWSVRAEHTGCGGHSNIVRIIHETLRVHTIVVICVTVLMRLRDSHPSPSSPYSQLSPWSSRAVCSTVTRKPLDISHSWRSVKFFNGFIHYWHNINRYLFTWNFEKTKIRLKNTFIFCWQMILTAKYEVEKYLRSDMPRSESSCIVLAVARL